MVLLARTRIAWNSETSSNSHIYIHENSVRVTLSRSWQSSNNVTRTRLNYRLGQSGLLSSNNLATDSGRVTDIYIRYILKPICEFYSEKKNTVLWKLQCLDLTKRTVVANVDNDVLFIFKTSAIFNVPIYMFMLRWIEHCFYMSYVIWRNVSLCLTFE